jgi:hypothetical protein
MNKPNPDDYKINDGEDLRFRDYIIDMVEFLAESGNEEAKTFPRKMLEEIFPEGMTVGSDPRNYDPLAQMLLQRLIRSSFASEVFDPMLNNIGSSIEEMKRIAEEGPARAVPGMNIPKNRISDAERMNMMAQALLEKMLDHLTPALLKAAATGRVDQLKIKITELEEAMQEASDMVIGPDDDDDDLLSAKEKIQEIIDYTNFFTRIIDSKETSNEDFNRFLNTLIGHLIAERVDEINSEVMLHSGKHEDHDVDGCNIHEAAALGIPVMHTLWRRYYGAETSDSALDSMTDLAAVFFDAYHNSIEFVGIAIHPALEKPVMNSLNENVPDNHALRQETFKIFTEYMKVHPEILESLKSQHEGDDSAAIMVNMYATTPNLKIMDDSYHKMIDNSAVSSFEALSEDIDEAIVKLLESE